MSAKLTEDFFHYIICDNIQQRGDVIALCQLLGLELLEGASLYFDFELAPNVLIVKTYTSNSYQLTCPSEFKSWDIPAKDFINDNF